MKKSGMIKKFFQAALAPAIMLTAFNAAAGTARRPGPICSTFPSCSPVPKFLPNGWSLWTTQFSPH